MPHGSNIILGVLGHAHVEVQAVVLDAARTEMIHDQNCVSGSQEPLCPLEHVLPQWSAGVGENYSRKRTGTLGGIEPRARERAPARQPDLALGLLRKRQVHLSKARRRAGKSESGQTCDS